MSFKIYNSKKITKLIKEEKIVPKNERITSDRMTIFEYCEVISVRAREIINYFLVFTNVDEETNPIDMAKKEIRDKKCPLSIKRYLSNGKVEIWEVNELYYFEN